MSKWLSKFTKKPRSPTDKADIVTSVSGMSVPDLPILAEKSILSTKENLKPKGKKHFIFHQINGVCTLASHEETSFEFEERAAIMEYEGDFAIEEAEDRAYQQILKEFVSGRYPEVLAECESIIYGKSSTFTYGKRI